MLVDNKWVPTFPNARYLLGRVKYEATRSRDQDASFDDPRSRGMRIVAVESLALVLDAGLVDFVETDHVVCDEVRLVPSQGHTEGHVSGRLTFKRGRGAKYRRLHSSSVPACSSGIGISR